MPTIYLHATFALLAVPLGVYLFIAPKGTRRHRLWGRSWVALLVGASLSGIFIQTIHPGEYSAIHLLIPLTLGALIYSIWNIQRYQKIRKKSYRYAHMYSMIGVYIGALLVAGAFTLMPGRLFYELLFG